MNSERVHYEGLRSPKKPEVHDNMKKENRTKYEKTRIIAARALQIAQGSPVLAKIPKNVEKPLEMAIIEWKKGLIPIDIKTKEDK